MQAFITALRAIKSPDRDTHGYVYIRVRRSRLAERINRLAGNAKVRIEYQTKGKTKHITKRGLGIRIRGMYETAEGPLLYLDTSPHSRIISAWRTETSVELSDILSLCDRNCITFTYRPGLGFIAIGVEEQGPDGAPVLAGAWNGDPGYWANTPRGAVELWARRITRALPAHGEAT